MDITWERYAHVSGRMMERALVYEAGFDCRGGCAPDCPHDPKKPDGGYGRHNDGYHLHMRFEDAVVVLSFFTSFFRSTTELPRRFEPVWLRFCTSFPTTEEGVRAGPRPCFVQRVGHCHTQDPQGLRAEELMKPHHEEIAHYYLQSPVREDVTRIVLALTPIWDTLGTELLERYERLIAESRELPKRCPTCSGKGVVPQ